MLIWKIYFCLSPGIDNSVGGIYWSAYHTAAAPRLVSQLLLTLSSWNRKFEIYGKKYFYVLLLNKEILLYQFLLAVLFYLPPWIENLAGGRSAYQTASSAPHFRLNIFVAIDPRLSKSKIWNLWGKKSILFHLIFFHLGLFGR